jgi:ABC-type uncharacterized transport system permease subunit
VAPRWRCAKAGLALFVMTFMVNTVAELVRQRLRERYKAI